MDKKCIDGEEQVQMICTNSESGMFVKCDRLVAEDPGE